MTPILRWNREQLISPMTLGAMEDMGYTIDRSQQSAFGLEDLDDCGAFCPEAGRRRRLGMSSTTRATTPTKPKLSEKAEMELKNAAAERFREQDRQLQKPKQGEASQLHAPSVVSYVYEEDGHFFSRTIRRHQVEHLI